MTSRSQILRKTMGFSLLLVGVMAGGCKTTSNGSAIKGSNVPSAKKSDSCDIVFNPNGAGYTAIFLGQRILTSYAAQPETTMDNAQKLLDSDACQAVTPLACKIEAHPNGSGYTGVLSKNDLIGTYNSDPQKTSARLAELQDMGFCADANLKRCELRFNDNGSGYSALFVNGNAVTGYKASVFDTLDQITDLTANKVCAGFVRLRCKIGSNPNGAGWTAVVVGDQVLTPYKEDSDDTGNSLADLKSRKLCR